MHIVVKPHSAVRHLIRAWRHSLSDDAERRHELATLYWDELVRRITEARGVPEGSIRDESTTPVT